MDRPHFWAGSLTAIVASAAIIFADDGWRAFHVSHVSDRRAPGPWVISPRHDAAFFRKAG